MPVRGELSGSAGLQPSVRRKGRSSSRYPEDFPVSTARARDGLPACVADLSCFILKMAARMLCHALSPVPDLDHRLTSFQGQPLTDQFMGNGVPVACIFNMVIRSHFHCPELGIFIGGERCQHRRFFSGNISDSMASGVSVSGRGHGVDNFEASQHLKDGGRADI